MYILLAKQLLSWASSSSARLKTGTRTKYIDEAIVRKSPDLFPPNYPERSTSPISLVTFCLVSLRAARCSDGFSCSRYPRLRCTIALPTGEPGSVIAFENSHGIPLRLSETHSRFARGGIRISHRLQTTWQFISPLGMISSGEWRTLTVTEMHWHFPLGYVLSAGNPGE